MVYSPDISISSSSSVGMDSVSLLLFCDHVPLVTSPSSEYTAVPFDLNSTLPEKESSVSFIGVGTPCTFTTSSVLSPAHLPATDGKPLSSSSSQAVKKEAVNKKATKQVIRVVAFSTLC